MAPYTLVLKRAAIFSKSTLCACNTRSFTGFDTFASPGEPSPRRGAVASQGPASGALLPYIVPGMAVYERDNERIGTVARVLPEGAMIVVDPLPPGARPYRIRADQLPSAGFARIRLRVTSAELERS